MVDDSLYKRLKIPGRRVHVRDARVGRRLVAFLIDLFVLDFFVSKSFTSLLVTKASLGDLLQGTFALSPRAYTAVVVIACFALAYFSLFEYVLGQTPGMMFLGLRATNNTLWRSVLRNVYCLPFFPFPLLWVVEPVYLFFGRPRFLERLSGTRTVESIYY